MRKLIAALAIAVLLLTACGHKETTNELCDRFAPGSLPHVVAEDKVVFCYGGDHYRDVVAVLTNTDGEWVAS